MPAPPLLIACFPSGTRFIQAQIDIGVMRAVERIGRHVAEIGLKGLIRSVCWRGGNDISVVVCRQARPIEDARRLKTGVRKGIARMIEMIVHHLGQHGTVASAVRQRIAQACVYRWLY